MYNGMEESTEVKKSLTSLGESRRIISTDQPTENDGGRGLSPDCAPVAGGALVADGIIARISMDKVSRVLKMKYKLTVKCDCHYTGMIKR